MDRVTGRRAYGLGSIFKSVKKAVSKVLKSDIGKMAILNFAPMAFGAKPFIGMGGGQFNIPGGNFLKNKLFMKNLAEKGKDALYTGEGAGLDWKKALMFGTTALPFIPGPWNKVPENESLGGGGGRGGSLIDPITKLEAVGGGAGMRETLQAAIDEADGDPTKLEAIDAKYNHMLNLVDNRPYPNYVPYATGGRIGAEYGGRIGYQDAGKVWGMDKAQAAWDKLGTNSKLGYVDFVDFFLNGPWGSNQYRTGSDKLAEGGRIGAEEGGLMNLGGMEKDYRAEGGFVPIGAKEKADDVPARLSVNEFVFTADAVRGAGGGDIDQGAEIMENVMKNLEAGGKISAETQGNTGAQEMFSVSERLGEVI
jgi:hypothetical protein